MFKENLRNLRKVKGLSQQQLADKLNVSFKTISHWKLGYSEPSLFLLIKLKEILNASYEELLD